MSAWTFAARGDRLRCRAAPGERAVLVDVVDGVVRLLGGDPADEPGDDGPGTEPPGATPPDPLATLTLGGPPVAAPRDPALRRLLPDASRTDPEVAAEFRRLTEDDLRRGKLERLAALRAALRHPDGVVVGREAAADVAAALTDVRLVLAERLGVRTDADADALYAVALGRDGADDDERALLATVYAVLTVLQESLVRHLVADLPGDGD